MDTDLDDNFGNALNVEVSVSTGGVSNVAYTCVVKIDDCRDRAAAMTKLRDIAMMLKDALPYESLKSDEHDFKKVNTPAMGPDGPLTREGAIAAGQEALKAVLAQKK